MLKQYMVTIEVVDAAGQHLRGGWVVAWGRSPEDAQRYVHREYHIYPGESLRIKKVE